MSIRLLLFSVSLLLLLPVSAWSYGDCVDGIPMGTGAGGENTGTCLCDTAVNAAGGGNVIWCEDFEANTMYYDVGQHPDVVLGNQSYPWGPSYDDTIQTGNRGKNGYWDRIHDSQSSRCSWSSGEPANPPTGTRCAFGQCAGNRIWHPDNLWGANFDDSGNNGNTCMAVIGDGDFDMEVSAIADPTQPNKPAGVFDGHFSHGARVPGCPGGSCANNHRAAGIYGRRYINSSVNRHTLGVTMAVAYSSNLLSSGAQNALPQRANGQPQASWKHWEWQRPEGENFHDAPLMFLLSSWDWDDRGGNRDDERYFFPFFLFHKIHNSASSSACTSQLGTSDLVRRKAPYTNGSFRLNKGMMSCRVGEREVNLAPENEDYQWNVDWKPGEWHCLRAEFTNHGRANMGSKIWVDQKLILDYSGFDGRILKLSGADGGSSPGYTAIVPNHFYNANQVAPYGGGSAQLSETVYVMYDNIVFTDGDAVSCEAIGFDYAGGGGPNPPPPPVLLP